MVWKKQIDGSYFSAEKKVLIFKERRTTGPGRSKVFRCAYHFPTGKKKCALTLKKAKELF